MFCEGWFDSGEICSYLLDGLVEGFYLKFQVLDGGWLFLVLWLELYCLWDFVQFWYFEFGWVLCICYGELDLEGGLQYWVELFDGWIVVGDYVWYVDFGMFESLC